MERNLAIMYVDTDKKKTVLDKIEWMLSVYEKRLGFPPKVILTHLDNVNTLSDEPDLEGLIINPTKGLNALTFVLCQEPSDFLAEKATPLPIVG